MRLKKSFCSWLGVVAALCIITPEVKAQNAPSTGQLIDRLLATVKPGQRFVLSGDVMLEVEKLRKMRGEISGGKQASSAYFQTNIWLGGKVPYILDPMLLPTQRTLFIEAIRELETVVGLKFVVRTNEPDYIRVFTDPAAVGFSYSLIGRVGGEQPLSLGAGGNRYVAIHEIMHALGIMHEQTRNDRDSFVSIDFTNLPTDAGTVFQFAIVDNSNNRGPYDYDSVMHYGQFDFAKDPTKPVITVRPPNQRFQNLIGNRSFISPGDIDGLQDIYGPPGEIIRPSNDFFAKAQLLEGTSGTVTGTNLLATKELGEPLHAGSTTSTSVWYRWRPANNGVVTFTTLGSSFDTSLAVYVGLSPRTLTPVAANDDIVPGAVPGEPGLTSSVTFPAQANAIYYIAVDGAAVPGSFTKSGESGAITLNWNQNVEASRSSISGSIKNSAGQGIGGVVINLSGATAGNASTTGTATTNSAGNYTIAGLLAGNYNLRAAKAGFTFSPNPRLVRLNGAATNQNFVATLIPEDLLPGLSVSDVNIREGKTNESLVTFNVTLSAPSKDTVTVSYATLDQTATAGSDYNALRGTLIFAPGVTTLSVTIRVRPDAVVESNETFGLQISGASGAKIVDDLGVATLVNDDIAT